MYLVIIACLIHRVKAYDIRRHIGYDTVDREYPHFVPYCPITSNIHFYVCMVGLCGSH
jgi:hypothetical protein